MTGTVRIGISGWNYAPRRGWFYPKDLPRKCELAYAASIFAVKGSRYITHLLRLKNVKTPLANFFASGSLRLGQKLGPILWQLPPSF